MPIYEYECDSCQKRFEHLQRRAADLPRACPHCAGKRLRKVISSFSLTAAARALAPRRPLVRAAVVEPVLYS